MKEIIDEYSPILEGKIDVKDVKEKQKQMRLNGSKALNKNKQPSTLQPLHKLEVSDKEATSNEESKLKYKKPKEDLSHKSNNKKTSHSTSNSTLSSSSHKKEE